jgi:hypothetical protein
MKADPMTGISQFFVQWRAIRRLVLARNDVAALTETNDGPPANSIW